jgi:hypothetical protein
MPHPFFSKMTRKRKLFKKRKKTVPMTPITKIVRVIESPGRVIPVASIAKPETEESKKTKIVNMVTEKLTIGDEEFDFETLEKFKTETGKRPVYAGKVTKAFREWLDQKHA